VPLGPSAGTPEPVGSGDLVATPLELATVAAALPREPGPARAPALPIVAAVALITAFGLAGADAHRHDLHAAAPAAPTGAAAR
jgi:hypothetical protein